MPPRGKSTDHERNAALAQEPGGRLHLRLVDLAAEVDDRGGPGSRGSRATGHRRGARLGRDPSAHHRTGFVDIRKAMRPTAVVIA